MRKRICLVLVLLVVFLSGCQSSTENPESFIKELLIFSEEHQVAFQQADANDTFDILADWQKDLGQTFHDVCSEKGQEDIWLKVTPLLQECYETYELPFSVVSMKQNKKVASDGYEVEVQLQDGQKTPFVILFDIEYKDGLVNYLNVTI